MKSFEDVLHSSADLDEVRFTTASVVHAGDHPDALDTGMIRLDDSALPAPVSSFDHVARSTASRESLVPPRPLWPFGLRAHPHRQAS